MFLALRTDKPEAEVAIYNENCDELVSKKWLAHKELSVTLMQVVEEMLEKASSTKDYTLLKGAVYFKGPGSFTGLRIGASYLNALEIPVVNTNGKNWIGEGLKLLNSGFNETAIPFYGSEAHTTVQKK